MQFAAHDGMMNRDQLLEHVRTHRRLGSGTRTRFAPRAGITACRGGGRCPATDIALRQLISRYCDAVVRSDVTQFASLWSPEAVWQLGKPIEGRDAVVAAFDKAMKGFAWVVQTAPNAVFEVDEANGSRYRAGHHQRDSSRRPRASAVHSWACTTTGTCAIEGAWQFAERRLEVIHRST